MHKRNKLKSTSNIKPAPKQKKSAERRATEVRIITY